MTSKKGTPGYKPRKINNREVKQRFLIICEGKETEPNYFDSFPVSKLVIVTKGIGKNPNMIVKEALKFSLKDEYDQIWCVFDRDSWTSNDFNTAIQQAKNHDFQVAYSNECFELWYILHFQFLNTPMDRNNYEKKLTSLFGFQYQKNSLSIYENIQYKQNTAIKNAETLLKQYNPQNPSQDNPSTTVHLLVKQLNRFIP